MKSFVPSLYKFILGMFLFGLALWANPIDGYCASPNEGAIYLSSPNFSFSGQPYIDLGLPNSNININGPLNQYGLVPYTSFDLNLSFREYISSSCSCYTSISFDVYVLFSSSNNGAFQSFVGSYGFSDSFINTNAYSYQYSITCSVDGVPTGVRIVFNSSFVYPFNSSINGTITDSNGTTSSVSIVIDDPSVLANIGFDVIASFSNFSLDSSSGSSGSSTVINNMSSNLTPIGYSSLNFGLNGNCYFLGSSRIFQPDYLSPLMFSYDFANNLSGIVSSAPLTFAMGGFDPGTNTEHAAPISVIGDTRAGEYELTLSFCLSHSPNASQLSNLVNRNMWAFEFNRGYSGNQFPLPSDSRISYTNFIDSKTGYCYTSVYFYFTTPDFFDSFLIRGAPALSDIRVGAFAFNKYTGTISDQLTQSNQQWDYQNPSHSSFSSANQSAASTVSAFSSIEADAFSNLDTAMSGAGVSDFNINVIRTPLATVSAMINQTYNILPDLVKWLLLAVLVIGIFAVIISANNYVNKD